MKLYLIPVFLLLPVCVFAQGDTSYIDSAYLKEPSKESRAYHEYRLTITLPPYGLAKILELENKIKKKEEDDDNYEVPNPKIYQALSFREKFTYHMIHPESYSQNCDAEPPIQDENKKVFSYLPDVFNERSWSERQRKFLIGNRDSVMAVIRESVARTKYFGLNYKHALEEINAKEMIPFIIEVYNLQKKDFDLLTLLMLLMKNGKCQPFLASMTYRKIYAGDADYRSFIFFNKANEELIIKRATDFYNGNQK